ncbi:MAG: alpha/beta hydrolase [Streptomyces sp.]|nr:alpha/beta hydrolase [Streptomyces sp.]
MAAEIAYRQFVSLGAAEKVHPRDAAIHARARIGALDVNGGPVVTYTWGTGPETVILVHGWRSRGSRWATLIAALESPERTIIAFDAPGNGDSPGDRTTVLDYAAIVRLLAARNGNVQAVVGHSFGVLASFLAVREGVSTARLVGISGMASATQLLDTFSAQIGLTERAKHGLGERFQRRVFPNESDLWHRFVAELDPTEDRIPLLLVHDDGDPIVPVAQVDLIAQAHLGALRVERTTGLGHHRILNDPDVVGAIRDFIDAPVDSLAHPDPAALDAQDSGQPHRFESSAGPGGQPA